MGLWVLIIEFYVVEYLVIIFFNAALVSAAIIRLEGGDPTLGDGLRGAWSHIGAILGYAALAATVGLVLQLLRERAGIAGVVLAALGGMAWNVITFLVIPVLAVAVIAVMVSSLLGATLHGIYSAAAYAYAIDGQTGAFDRETLAGAFRPKRSRGDN